MFGEQMSLLDELAADEESTAARAVLAQLISAGEQPGLANRQRMVAAWRAVHGAYIVPTRFQHPWWLWEPDFTSPGARFSIEDRATWQAENPGVHVPTLLKVDRREAHDEKPSNPAEEHIWHRAACLGCDFEGAPHIDENTAVEEAHDHTHPWWRELPVVDKPRADDAPSKVAKARSRVTAIYEEARPGCTEIPYCPVRTWRTGIGTRHHSGGILGGYDLGVPREALVP